MLEMMGWKTMQR